MALTKIEIPVVRSGQFFNLSPTTFIVTAPTSDGALQVVFCDDYVDTDLMTLEGEISEDGTANASSLTATFSGKPERMAHGRIKLSLASAKALSDLLAEHIGALEKLLGSTGTNP